MLRRAFVLLAAIAIYATSVPAQSSTASVLSGRVIDENGQPVAFASVSTPSGAQLTTRQDGTFVLPLGKQSDVKMVVRQIGFHPESLSVTLGKSGLQPELTVKMTRNAISLSTVVINAPSVCSASDSGNARAHAEMKPVFDAVEENVFRTVALLRTYPIRAEMEILVADSSEKGRGKDKKVKNKRTSEGKLMPYVPGNVIRYSDRGMMIVPLTLAALADSVFQSTHCFHYAVEETLDGKKTLRIDFAPNSQVAAVDWAGSFVLDAHSYVLREKRSSLVYPPSIRGKQQYMKWDTIYEEIFPGLVDLASDKRTSWAADQASSASPVKVSLLETRTIKRSFIKGTPGQ